MKSIFDSMQPCDVIEWADGRSTGDIIMAINHCRARADIEQMSLRDRTPWDIAGDRIGQKEEVQDAQNQ